MDIFKGLALQKEILKQVEERLGRKLTENEVEVFKISSRLGLIKGEKCGRNN
ncbi:MULTISPECIES: hypothetical protein [Bacillus cereus group]|uniref:hypothetical protein n=1 Tax=Bacillus cereus group TaxID=86661 RepID=UPI000A4A6EF5|nr:MULTISPECIES: hypothetical protein [Bacillus cereus group]MCM0006214.1 hypothetical protein [Bacillus paranthracis]MDX6046675.1 hypothetical protein [Bacillus paranthracis]